MQSETRKVLDLGLSLPPAERVALARELMRSAAAENAAFAGEVGEAVSVYDQGPPPAPFPIAAAEGSSRGVSLTLEYWQEDGWYVGRLGELPGVFSQGETLAELEANIRDAYGLVVTDLLSSSEAPGTLRKRIEVGA